MRWLPPLFLIAILLSVPLSHAKASEVREIPLPDGAENPLALAFDPEGFLWLTLDGSWALGRFDPATGDFSLLPLSSPKADERDSLWALRFGPDGEIWTGSQTAIHRVDPLTGIATAFPLDTRTILPGDIHITSEGDVWYALVTADRIARLNPATGEITEHETPGDLFGPLHFLDAGPHGIYLTATYGDTYAKLDPSTGRVEPAQEGLLDGPVGLVRDGSAFWVAEMGGSTVARIDPATGERERFPTTPTDTFPASGPSDILVAQDGAVWFAEHFADRIARLDVQNRTLHEYLLPSAPGTDVQRVAEGPDGRIWFAEWSTNKIGYVIFGDEVPGFELPAHVEVRRGETVHIPFHAPDSIRFGTGASGLEAAYESGELVIDTSKAEPGTHNLLVSVDQGTARVGRYLSVTVEAPPAEAPVAPVAVSLLVVLSVALLRRQKR